MIQRDRKTKVELCACCGKPAEVDVWQYRLCVGCHARWHREVGVPPDSAQYNPDANVRQAAWRDASETWLKGAR